MAIRMRFHTLRSVTSAILMATSSRSFSTLAHPAAKSVSIPADNLNAIQDLEPKSLWSQFAILSSIPRPSKQEDAVLQYIKEFADHHNLRWKQDAVGNLVVFHPGCGSAIVVTLVW